MRYAEGTEVSVGRSRAEIEETCTKYGASGFVSGWQGCTAMVCFEMRERRIKFLLPLPDRGDKRFTETRVKSHVRSPEQAAAAWEQACRQRWRALLLAIKAKLEAVECGITTFDDEFLAHIVMPDGLTIGERLTPQMAHIIKTGKLPPLLPGPSQEST